MRLFATFVFHRPEFEINGNIAMFSKYLKEGDGLDPVRISSTCE